MRRLVLIALIILGVIPVTAATAAQTTSSAGKPASCTPRKHVSRWTDIQGAKKQSRTVIVFPKGTGHIVVGGFCHVNAKGLGKSHKEFRDKPTRKHVTPPVKPPTIIVGDPPPPVTPPPAPTVSYSCDHTGRVPPTDGSGTVLVNIHFKVANVTFVRATFDFGDGATSTSDFATYNPLDGTWEADGNHTYIENGNFLIKGTVTIAVSNGIGVAPTLVTTEIQAVSPDPNNPTTCSTSVVTTGLPSLPPPILPPPDIT